jgi:hypothetical protein
MAVRVTIVPRHQVELVWNFLGLAAQDLSDNPLLGFL